MHESGFRRRPDRLWMFPGGRKRGAETEKEYLRREIGEEFATATQATGDFKIWN